MTDHTQPIYRAERIWRGYTPSAGRFLTPRSAFDLAGEAIHHQNMDDLPGIQHVRDSFTPDKFRLHMPGTDFELPDKLHAATSNEGHLVFRPENLTAGMVTHETSHLISRLNTKQFEAHLPPHDVEFARQHVLTAHSVLGRVAGRRLADLYEQHGIELGR